MKAYKITLTAIYNDDNVDPEKISDGVWKALQAAGNGVALCNVTSIRKISKVDEEIRKIKESLVDEK